MGIRQQGITFSLLVKVCERDAVRNLDGEPKIIRHRATIFLHILRAGQFDLVAPKQRPEPLVNLYRVVTTGVLCEIVNALGSRINQPVPGWELPTTRTYSDRPC